jgi:hypothetical protein
MRSLTLITQSELFGIASPRDAPVGCFLVAQRYSEFFALEQRSLPCAE